MQAAKAMKALTLDLVGFRPIFPDQYLERVRQEVCLLGKRNWVRPTPARKPGRPRKEATIHDKLYYVSGNSDGDKGDESDNSSNLPAKYKCWFQIDLWEKIEVALKLHSFKIHPTLTYLKRKN